VGGVEGDGVGDVVDHVADADRGGGLGHVHLRGGALGAPAAWGAEPASAVVSR
jgi:hypothetical protein